MIQYDDIEDSLLRRMARRITVRAVTGIHGFHCRAFLPLTYQSHPCESAPGYPYALIAHANTAEAAVDQILIMLDMWFRDPLDKDLSLKTDFVWCEALRRSACGSGTQTGRTNAGTSQTVTPKSTKG